VIQGYNGVAVVDDKHQVIVHTEAFGAAQEHDLLEPMIEGTRDNFDEIGSGEDVFEKAKLVADSGYHTEANMQMVMEEGIDAYIADTPVPEERPEICDCGQIQGAGKEREGGILRDKRVVPGQGIHDKQGQEILHMSGRQAPVS